MSLGHTFLACGGSTPPRIFVTFFDLGAEDRRESAVFIGMHYFGWWLGNIGPPIVLVAALIPAGYPRTSIETACGAARQVRSSSPPDSPLWR